MKNLKKAKKILKRLIITILLMIIIINVTLIVKSELNKDIIPDFLGFTPFIIISGSMEPAIKTNDVIITKKIARQEDIKINDVISYSTGENIVITHRVVDIQKIGENYFYVTKGDNNKSNDKILVSYSQIQGKYICSIPMIGMLVTYVKTPRGMGMVIFIVILLYILYDIAVREFLRNKQKLRLTVK